MQLSPDFFSYFEALAPVLDRDPMLWCVSSWNDHGQVGVPKVAVADSATFGCRPWACCPCLVTVSHMEQPPHCAAPVQGLW